MKLPVYLDHSATTPLDPRVLEAMIPCLQTEFGNPSSTTHLFGRSAEKLVQQARVQVAGLLGAEPGEIIFTSSTTESNNLALKGLAEMFRDKGRHIITQVTEHKSVLEPAAFLEKRGISVTYLPVDATGQVRLDDLKKAITNETVLISVMSANNEIGTLQPVRRIGEIAKERRIFFHTDAAQAVGKIPVRVDDLGADLVSFSAHKMYGPKGVGALYVRGKNPRVRLEPLIHGGGQEFGLRSGTLNVPAIVGFAKACEITALEMEEESRRLSGLRDRLQNGLRQKLKDACVNGHPVERLPNHLNMSFPFVENSGLLGELVRDVAVSSGSACGSENPGTSYVLKALGLGADKIHTSLRFGIGRFNTAEEIDFVIERVTAVVQKLREASPLYQAHKEFRT